MYVEGNSIQQTSGQSSNTANFSGNKITFRQGFQQPPIILSNIKSSANCQLLLFPNPIVTDAVLNVPLTTKSYNIWICDILGKVIYFEKNITIDKLALSAVDFISGEYFIKILYEDGSCCTLKFIVIK